MEQERRQEILKAEETIRQLAAEMARVSRTAAEVDIVKSKLDSAHSALEQAKASLDSASAAMSETESSSRKAMTQASETAVAALAETRGRLEQIAKHVPKSIEEFSSKLNRQLEDHTAQLRGLVIWAVVLSAAATIIGVAGLVLSRMR